MTGNLADGVELDEMDDGDVVARARHSHFDHNGDAGSTIDGLTDLDDGFDIDETGPGDLDVRSSRSASMTTSTKAWIWMRPETGTQRSNSSESPPIAIRTKG